MSLVQRAVTACRWALTAIGALASFTVIWLAAGGPVLIDRFVIEQDQPQKADAIVCLAGGLEDHHLPGGEGWRRIYAAVQLHADGYAPALIFSGGGVERVSEAEVYAEAARWLGADPATIRLDPTAATTNEHPAGVLALEGRPVTRASRLLIVTSRIHSKRAAMCFRKAGFTNIRVVSDYVSASGDPRIVREARESHSPSFRRNRSGGHNPWNALQKGIRELAFALRETAAIAVYKVRGYV